MIALQGEAARRGHGGFPDDHGPARIRYVESMETGFTGYEGGLRDLPGELKQGVYY